MQMGAGCAAGMSDQADDLSLFYDFSGFYFSFFQMGINRLQPLTVVDDDHVAGVKIVFAAQNDFAAARALTGVPSGAAMSVPLWGLFGVPLKIR